MRELRLTREEWQKYDEIEKKIRELEYVLNSPSIERTLLLETRQPDPAGWTDKNYIAFVSFDPDTYIRDEIKCLKAKLKEFANAR